MCTTYCVSCRAQSYRSFARYATNRQSATEKETHLLHESHFPLPKPSNYKTTEKKV